MSNSIKKFNTARKAKEIVKIKSVSEHKLSNEMKMHKNKAKKKVFDKAEDLKKTIKHAIETGNTKLEDSVRELAKKTDPKFSDKIREVAVDTRMKKEVLKTAAQKSSKPALKKVAQKTAQSVAKSAGKKIFKTALKSIPIIGSLGAALVSKDASAALPDVGAKLGPKKGSASYKLENNVPLSPSDKKSLKDKARKSLRSRK